MEKRTVFRGHGLPWLLLAPQLAITLVFFLWPASQALWQALFVEDAFGLGRQYVGMENLAALLHDDQYRNSLRVTAVFSLGVTALALGMALLLAGMADHVGRGAIVLAYRTLLIWPYAVAPAIAGMLWLFMFNPSVGIVAWLLSQAGYSWNHQLNGGQAMLLVILAAAWKQVSYNFLFLWAGMQSVPTALVEAAAIDGAGPVRRFRTIVLPLISPTLFFLLVVNVVYAFFDTFGVIHAVTSGGPGQATTTLVYKVFSDGFVGLDLGGSAAQSVVLMVIVVALTAVQFRYVEHRVQYG
jgi:sn-glycerol 3-phosphate transport system permease protein